MKVIHLPVNISSQIAVTVQAQRSLGIDARGLVRKFSPIQDCSGLDAIAWGGKPNPIARLVRSIHWHQRLLRALAWADVIHWHWGESTWKGRDLRAAAWLGKPRLVEFWGDDLRIPERAARDNPFIARMYAANPDLTVSHSLSNQRLFHKHGFACLIPGLELSDYLDPECYPEFHRSHIRIAVDQFEPSYPGPATARPIVAHAPSHKLKKGTEAVHAVVAKLAREIPFEFKLIHNVPRPEALRIVAGCDVFLDQFTIGAEGLAAYEAMAFGKPVVCYIKPSLQPRYPTDFPIVLADQNTLETVLAGLLKDGARRRALGEQSRRYVQQHHDARKVAAELIHLYERLGAHAQGRTALAQTSAAKKAPLPTPLPRS